MRGLITIAAAVGAAAFLLTAAPAAEADEPAGPEVQSYAAAYAYALVHPDAMPEGANDWSCRPSAEHPRPVVLVHGSFENAYIRWAGLSPTLKRAGYCVFALNYGDTGDAASGTVAAVQGYGDIRSSAKELAAFVDRVLAATGADQADIVAHSQGGPLTRQYLKFEGGADSGDPAGNKVHTLITTGATNHGTTLSGLATLADSLHLFGVADVVLGESAVQQAQGSEFLATLNAGGDTLPGIDYTVLATRYDEVSTPYQATFLAAGPGAPVANITVQDGCEIDLSDHQSMPYSPRTVGYVSNALDPAHSTPPPCTNHLPVI